MNKVLRENNIITSRRLPPRKARALSCTESKSEEAIKAFSAFYKVLNLKVLHHSNATKKLSVKRQQRPR